MKKRLLSILLTMNMVLSLLPTSALAAEAANSGGPVTEDVVLEEDQTGPEAKPAGGLKSSDEARLADSASTGDATPSETIHESKDTEIKESSEQQLVEIDDGQSEKSASDSTSGTCGDNLTWSYSAGTLTIQGTGAMWNYNRTYELAPWLYTYMQQIHTVRIGDGVTGIGAYAFWTCRGLTSITIPNSVINIGYMAFANCSSLTSITIPHGVRNIDGYICSMCTALTDVALPANATITKNAFEGCTNIKNVKLIGTGPMADHIVSWGDPKSDTNTPWYIGSIAGNDIKVEIADGVTSVGADAFLYCKGLTHVVIPDSVTTIKMRAFIGCSSLTSVTIPPSVSDLDEGSAFADCTSLAEVVISSGVSSLGYRTFKGCSALTNITIPNSITSIGDSVFSDCSGLTSVTIPHSVTSIEDGAFYRCDNLKDIYYSGSEIDWATISIGCDNTALTNAAIHYNSAGPKGEFSFTSPDPSTCIQVGDTWELNVKHISGGKVKDSDFIYAISDSDTFDVVRVGKSSEGGQDYLLTAKKPGYCTVTFTNPSNGEAALLEVYAVNGESGYTFDTVPQMTIEEGKTTNFYNYSGLVVDEFKSIPVKDENGNIQKYRVTMTVYNSLNLYAAVTSYDENGDMKGFYLIDKMSSQPSSFTSTLTGLWYRIGDLAHQFQNEKYYSGKGITQETKVDIDVFPGGYLEISNSASSDIAVLANTVGMMIESAKTVKDLATHASALEEHKTEIIMKVLMDTFSNENFSKKICKTVKKSAVDEFKNMEWSYDTFGNQVQAFLDRLSLAGVNLVDTLAKEIVSVTGVMSITESVLFAVIPTGNLINYLYDVAGLADKANFWDSFMKSAHFPQGIYLYAPGGGNEYLSNGVRVASEEQIKQDTLIHAYLILDVSKLSGSKYQTYNITMYRNGEKTQPDSPVTVSIPVPDGYRAKNLKVYRRNDDGTVTDMDARVVDGYVVFTTTHFSYYALVDSAVGGIFLSAWTPGETTTVQLSDPGGQLAGASFFAASYEQDGQLAQIVSGTYSSTGQISFHKQLSKDWELFILDSATYTPLCPSITLPSPSQ